MEYTIGSTALYRQITETLEDIVPSVTLDASATENIPEQISDRHNEIRDETTIIADHISEDAIASEIKPTPKLEEKLDALEIPEKLAVVAQLKQEEANLNAELDRLKTEKTKILQEQIDDLQAGIIRLAQADVARLEYQKQELQAVSYLQDGLPREHPYSWSRHKHRGD